MEVLIASIAMYGVVWGAFHYWGLQKGRHRVLARPERYSRTTVGFFRFYGNSSLVVRAAISFALALIVPVCAIAILVLLHL